jgi:hypothetical protein
MEESKNYLSLTREVRMRFLRDSIAELYPFSDIDIDFCNDKLDFKILSYNSIIK